MLMAQRRRTAAYATPAAAVDELRVVGESVRRGVSACANRPMRWLRQNFSAADYLTPWSDVEAVLIATGRVRVPEDAPGLADRLPAFG